MQIIQNGVEFNSTFACNEIEQFESRIPKPFGNDLIEKTKRTDAIFLNKALAREIYWFNSVILDILSKLNNLKKSLQGNIF